jgi:hypothetical protein
MTPPPNKIAQFASFLRTVIASAVTLLFFTTLLGGQRPPRRQYDDVVSSVTQDALTRTIADRIHQAWAAVKKRDAVAYNAMLTEDFRGIPATGVPHFYRPTAQGIASLSIDQYVVSQLQALPIGHEGALATYILQILFQNADTPVKVAVGEVWVKHGDEWKCQYSQATLTP